MKTEWICGINAVKEALNSNLSFEQVLVNSKIRNTEFKSLAVELKKKNIPFKSVPVAALNRLYKGAHQGIIAFVSPIEYFSLEDILNQVYSDGRLPFILILDQLTDVRNFGAVSRSARAFGIDAIVIPVHNSVQVSPDAIKTSVGALLNISVCRVQKTIDAVHLCQETGLNVIGLTEKSKTLISESDLSLPLAMVIGNEQKGISTEVMNILKSTVRIPMVSDWDSLNVSVASGLAMYKVFEKLKH